MAEAPLVAQLRSLELQLDVQNANRGIIPFHGEAKKYKRWIKEIEKHWREKLCWTCGEPDHIAKDCPLKGGN